MSSRFDSLVSLFSPSLQRGREKRREDKRQSEETLIKAAEIIKEHEAYRYDSARSSRERPNAPPLESADSVQNQLDGIAMLRRAEELDNDSVIFGSIKQTFATYVAGAIDWIPDHDGEPTEDLYRDWLTNVWMPQADATGRFHFVDLVQRAYSGGILLHGDFGFLDHHRDDGSYQIQGIEGICIGNPNIVSTDPERIRGVILDPETRSVPIGYEIYSRSNSNQFTLWDDVAACNFSHLNPVKRVGQYKAVTPFHAVLNDATDIKAIEAAWLGKIKWTAFKLAVYNTPGGTPPEMNANQLDYGPGSPIQNRVKSVAAGEELHGEEGFGVQVLENNTPTANEIALLEMKIAEIAASLCIPVQFVWTAMAGMGGTFTRLISEMAGRTFKQGPMGQNWLVRTFLQRTIQKALMSGILTGQIPWSRHRFRGKFLFAAHPTVDVGRESAANLAENAQGITPMAIITGEQGRYWKDSDKQLGKEAENKIRLAQEIGKRVGLPWESVMNHLQVTVPNGTPPPTPVLAN